MKNAKRLQLRRTSGPCKHAEKLCHSDRLFNFLLPVLYSAFSRSLWELKFMIRTVKSAIIDSF